MVILTLIGHLRHCASSKHLLVALLFNFQPIETSRRSLLIAHFTSWTGQKNILYMSALLWSPFRTPVTFSSGWQPPAHRLQAAMVVKCVLPLLANSLLTTPPQLAQELPANLSAKLDHQFEKYKSGHNYLIGQIFNSNTTMITKTEWEDLLSPVQ
jgi:hypothetical protein